MATCYFESRNQSARGTDSLVADVMRHLHTRQHLGKTVIVCEQPVAALSAARKQWLKLSRNIQKQRASTLNADKILKYTHTITHMQHMLFSAKPPLEQPEGGVYFLHPEELSIMPVRCWSVYLLCSLPRHIADTFLPQLPAGALIIDYKNSLPWAELGLQPKKVLEAQVANQWRQARQYLLGYQIHIGQLARGNMQDIEAMDDALDTLLGVSHTFLEVAGEFQRALEMARPLRLSNVLRQSYDALILLAHRVQALSPGAFGRQFLEVYNEDDTFFLYDNARARLPWTGERLAEAWTRQMQAGRQHLARALQLLAETQAQRERLHAPLAF